MVRHQHLPSISNPIGLCAWPERRFSLHRKRLVQPWLSLLNDALYVVCDGVLKLGSVISG